MDPSCLHLRPQQKGSSLQTYNLSKVDPIDEVIPMPPEVTYQETQQKIIRERKNIEHLASYTRRENRLAIVGKMID